MVKEAAADTLRLAQGSSAAQESDTSIKCDEDEVVEEVEEEGKVDLQ